MTRLISLFTALLMTASAATSAHAATQVFTATIAGTLSAQGSDPVGLDGANFSAEIKINVQEAPDSSEVLPAPPFTTTLSRSFWNTGLETTVSISSGGTVLLEETIAGAGRLGAFNRVPPNGFLEPDFFFVDTAAIPNPFGGGFATRIDLPVLYFDYADQEFFAGAIIPQLSDLDIGAATPRATDLQYRSASAGPFFDYQVSNAVIAASVSPAPIPLPASAWLLGIGLAGLGYTARRRKSV